MQKLITSALPYVNNIPHLGNLIGSILSADVYARYCRLRGYSTLYICATDEYGTATEIKALELNCTPEEICEKYRKIHKKVYDFFNIKFDYFGKTPTSSHTKITQDFFLELEKGGYIFEKENQQFYCLKDKMFLADRFIEGFCPFCEYPKAKGDQCDSCGKLLEPANLKERKCKICQNSPILKTTNHFYLDLEKLKKPLQEYFKKNSKGWSNNAFQATKKALEEELQPRPISRDLKWGVPFPKKDSNKVFYVWFDAVLGYISATMEHLPDKWQEWWIDSDAELYQFMAKDNIVFHTVLLPAMMLGYKKKNWTLLHHLNSCEYLNYEKKKFSKSEKIGVFGDDVIKMQFPADVWRFYLLYNRPESSDTNFNWDSFYQEINGQLVDNLGNLLNRVCTFLKKYFQGSLKISKEQQTKYQPSYQSSCDLFLNHKKKITQFFDAVKLKQALQQTLLLAGEANRLFQLQEPWKKINSDKEEVGYLLYLLIALLKDLSIFLYPFTPTLSEKIFKILNIPPSKLHWKNIDNDDFLKMHCINKPEILLEKIDYQKIMEYKKKYS